MITAKPGDRVTVHYTITFLNGAIFDSTQNKDPMTFILGKNQFFKGFEEAIEGMSINQLKKITVKACDAFGKKDKNLLISYPINKIPSHILLKEGKKIEITKEDGNVVIVTISEIKDDTVTLDANSELAGKDLRVSVELISID